MSSTPSIQRLKLLPAYLGVALLDEALQHPRIGRILQLEILMNDAIDWTTLGHPLIQPAYRTACRWHTTYRTLVSSLVCRASLPEDRDIIDNRLYRQFSEAIEFFHTHP